ncbi:MAG: hydroxyacid dehydrogenase [Clostridia bacterium]|nr:hydroxyacid dehydrogenase [Clostridia bacterium]
MNITVLDAASIGYDIDYSALSEFGELVVYDASTKEEVCDRLKDTEVAVLNKIKIGEKELASAPSLKLICIAATGYDNIDLAACRKNGVGVCNVVGYSTDSVAQLTVAMALSLACKLKTYTSFVESGEYSASSAPNKIEPVFHELAGKTRGIFGYGNIGKKVAKIAQALGCRVIACKRSGEGDVPVVDADTLCQEADIISLHVPLNEGTRHLINRQRLSKMKKTVMLINVARGAVTDEQAVADAVLRGDIAALGCDVYDGEPMKDTHPYYAIKELPQVLLTPHMAWAAFEARKRCLSEICENIRAFTKGKKRSRVDLV